MGTGLGPHDAPNHQHLRRARESYNRLQMSILFGVIVAMVGAQAAGAPKAIADPYEEAISAWKPAPAYRAPTGIPVTDATHLIGKWSNFRQMESTRLTFERAGEGKLRVHFASSGCLGGSSAVRTAILSGGIVTLNRGVSPYAGDIFDRLYLLRRNGQLWLVPAGAVERAEELAGDKPSGREHWVEFFGLQKRDR